MKAIKDNRGVTLVELVVSIAIFGLVAAAAITMLVFASQINADISVDTIENMKIVSAFDLIKSQVRQSDSVEVKVSDEKFVYFKLKNGVYTLHDDKFVYKAEISSDSETVLFEGVKNITVINTSNVDYLSISFEFNNGEIRQLTVGCKDK